MTSGRTTWSWSSSALGKIDPLCSAQHNAERFWVSGAATDSSGESRSREILSGRTDALPLIAHGSGLSAPLAAGPVHVSKVIAQLRQRPVLTVLFFDKPKSFFQHTVLLPGHSSSMSSALKKCLQCARHVLYSICPVWTHSWFCAEGLCRSRRRSSTVK